MTEEKFIPLTDIELDASYIDRKLKKYNRERLQSNKIIIKLCEDILEKTNKYLIADFPLTEKSRTKLIDYRKKIRDFLYSNFFENSIKRDLFMDRPLLYISLNPI